MHHLCGEESNVNLWPSLSNRLVTLAAAAAAQGARRFDAFSPLASTKSRSTGNSLPTFDTILPEMTPRSAPRSAPRSNGRRKGHGRRWSRRERIKPSEKSASVDYAFSDDAGEPMLSWAQAQQTVKLGPAHAPERFTIAQDINMTSYPSSQHAGHSHHHPKAPKSPKKHVTGVPSAKASYSVVKALQKEVDRVEPPPDAQQESYVCDEEDNEMLKLVNSKKRFKAHGQISTNAFEEAITLLERESIKCRGANTSFTLPVDEDAVCCVCQKGDCDNTNMILFCDMCNLAVHQECYGVPYIPEGQWHCRRCMVSPASTVQCLLCPNSEGALKQTEDGHWAHVICAMYIPKVNFKSTQLLEPVMNIDQIEKSRWNLKCVVCKSQPDYVKGGACIQCEEKSCKTAFHVTCAQKAGYYMDLKPTKEDDEDETLRARQQTIGDTDDAVVGVAYCEKHSKGVREEEALPGRKKAQKKSAVNSVRNSGANKAHTATRMDSCNIAPDKLKQIAVQVKMHKKPELFELILFYWKSKRRHRNGLPLLKRPKGRNAGARAANHEELERQRLMTSSALLRLDKLRTSMEYQLRRDKIDFRRDKLSDVRQGFEVMPAKCVLDHHFERIRALDKDKIFAAPVTEKIAPKYFSIISHPMDFSTISRKLDEAGAYSTFESFEADVNLVVDNCLKYNQPDTVFYKFALNYRKLITPMMEEGRKDYREFVTERTQRSTSIFNMTGNPSTGDLESGSDNAKKSDDDDLLSEISLVGDTEELRRDTTVTLNGDGRRHPREDHPIASTSSSSATCSSPLHSRTIPASPRSRKGAAMLSASSPTGHHLNHHHPDDSNDFDSGPARKKVRSTPADVDETNASSSRVPTPPPVTSLHNAMQLRPAMTAYRNGRLTALASESEPDPPFTSEDSTDHPSDNDQDSDAPAYRLRRKRRFSSTMSSPSRREFILYRMNDFVWVRRPGFPPFPGIIVNDQATKGISVNGHIIPAPPQDVVDSLSLQSDPNSSQRQHLVYFFDGKKPATWAWFTGDKLDLFGLDEKKDEVRLAEATKAHEKRAVKKAYDLAYALMHHSGGGGRQLRSPTIPNGNGSAHAPRALLPPGESDLD
ncbi:Bromodomain and PHD finger-containing protein 3 [Hypsibius exemplaris]|uniref:Bromodomain and PHD finger-containing protein 3 n=1 Tax=Hypsibius exemplaris TaxID=2072580 RepID=A0A1W0X9S4_HYPEX|nr:Bromodomain and PHD finger-containing protein 3 [Hypsibius exemplaris]